MADAHVEAAAAATDPSEHESTREVERREEEGVSVVASASSKDSGGDDHKRKLDDLEPFEREDEAPLKKKEVSFGAEALDCDEAGSSGGRVEVDDAGVDEESASALAGQADAAVGVGSTGVITTYQAEAADERDIESTENGISVQAPLYGAGNEKTDAEEEHRDNGVNNSGIGVQFEMQNSGQYDGNDSLHSAENTLDASAPLTESESTSLKIDVPNNKVGILIGKAGDTIKSLQYSSGAKIQITKDAEADRQSSTRSVELIGTLECINKAEKLIRDVIAEADAGGSPSLVARGFGTLQSGGDETEIKVPNEKVGLIIGKGGETIRNLQTRSCARIQLIPQQLAEGDFSKERTVRITGNKKQIETAKEMIKEVINQTTMRPSSLSGGYSQQNFHHWGSSTQTQWGVQATGEHTMGYGYQQRGRYQSSQAARFTQPHGTHPHQPPRGSFGAGWDQRPTTGYDYYGHPTGTQSSHPMPNNTATNPPSMNYNSGQPQGPNYGHPAQPTQPNYGQSYNEPKYDGQGQQYYGQQPMGMQSGAYGQQMSAPQPGYSQQQSFGQPAFGVPTQGLPPSYPPPRPSQLGDPMYQSSGPPTYASTGPTQQSYPYGSNAPPQQSTAYNQTYAQQPAAYSQQGGQYTSAYVQGGEHMPAYSQPGAPPGGYAQYPVSQQSYGDPSANNAAYGYAPTAPASAGYALTAPATGYATTAPAGSNLPGYVQPPANP